MRNAGMLPDKGFYAGNLSQALSHGNQAEQCRSRDR